MQVCNVLRAARWKYRTQTFAICAPSHNFVGLYLRNYGIYRQSEKLLNNNISSTCLYIMANFGPLTTEISWRVCGTQQISTGFASLASLLHRLRSTEVNHTLHDVWPSSGLVHYICYSNSVESVISWNHQSFQSITVSLGHFMKSLNFLGISRNDCKCCGHFSVYHWIDTFSGALDS